MIVEELLNPLTMSRFRENFWESVPYVWNANGTNRAALHRQLLPFDPNAKGEMQRWVASLVGVSGSTQLQAQTDVLFVRNGEMRRTDTHPFIPPAVAMQLLDARSSLVVHMLAHRLPVVAKLCQAFAAAVGFHVGANLYFTPPGKDTQALRLHYDKTDVLVLQLYGAKQWSVLEPAVKLNRKSDPTLDAPALEALGLREQMGLTLHPGDMLYLPRGTPHVAYVAQHGAYQALASSHVTLSLEVYTWQTVEAAVHRVLIGMHTSAARASPLKLVATDRSQRGSSAHMATGGPLSSPLRLPASLVVHAAIRAVANGQQLGGAGSLSSRTEASQHLRAGQGAAGAAVPAGSGVHWRRAASFAGVPEEDAVRTALGEICEARPTALATLRAMLDWPSPPTAAAGASSPVTVWAHAEGLVRDLQQLSAPPGTAHDLAAQQALQKRAAATYAPLVELHARLVEALQMMTEHVVSEEAERNMRSEWQAFCSQATAGNTNRRQDAVSDALEWQRQTRQARLVPQDRVVDQNLRRHGWEEGLGLPR